MRSIVLVAGVDDAFARPTAVMLRSALESLADDVRATIYVIDGGVSRASQDKVAESIAGLDHDLKWLDVPKGAFAGIRSTSRWGHSAYLRVLIPRLLPPTIDRALYLDADIVVCDDLSALWVVDVSTAYLGAVVGEPPEFNSGVLLLNLDRWRRDDTSRAVIDWIVEHQAKLKFADQQALNAIVGTEWKELDPRWNVPSHVFRGSPSDARFVEAKANPGILHFTGPRSRKPWANRCRHPLQRRYLEIEERTAWHGVKPRRLTLLDRLGPFGRRIDRFLRAR